MTASTNASGWVWWAAWRAPGITTTRPSARRASRAVVASAKAGRLSPPRIWRTGCRTSPSASRPAAAASPSAAQLARDRVGRRDPQRPHRIGPVRRQCRLVHADDPPHERLEQRLVVAGSIQLGELRGEARVPVPAARRRRRSLVAHDPPDRAGAQGRAQRASPAVRVPDDVDRVGARRGDDRLGDRRDVLELPLDRIRQRVARRAPTAPVDGVDGAALGQPRPDDPERRVVARRPVHEDHGGPGPAREHRDRRAVGGDDRSARGRRHPGASGRQRYSTSGWCSMLREPSEKATGSKPRRS